jgi:uncharacterized membrane protein YsdA (DUF1294 family)
MRISDQSLIFGLAVMNAGTFLLFAWDKSRARSGGRRISVRHLLLACALGGWLGGAVAMRLFRHKTAQTSFRVRHALAGIFCVAWIGFYLWWRAHD